MRVKPNSAKEQIQALIERKQQELQTLKSQAEAQEKANNNKIRSKNSELNALKAQANSNDTSSLLDQEYYVQLAIDKEEITYSPEEIIATIENISETNDTSNTSSETSDSNTTDSDSTDSETSDTTSDSESTTNTISSSTTDYSIASYEAVNNISFNTANNLSIWV